MLDQFFWGYLSRYCDISCSFSLVLQVNVQANFLEHLPYSGKSNRSGTGYNLSRYFYLHLAIIENPAIWIFSYWHLGKSKKVFFPIFE